MTKAQKYREWKEFLKDDEDYDWSYILRVLRYKLERTRKCIVANDIVADVKKIERQIQEVEKLLKKVEEDKYLEEELKILEKKYGKRNLKIKSKPSSRKSMSDATFTSNWDKLPPRQRGAAKRSLKFAYARAFRNKSLTLKGHFPSWLKT